MVYLLADEIASANLPHREDLDTSRCKIFATDPNGDGALLAQLAMLGITFSQLDPIPKPPGAFTGGEMLAEVTFTINKGIRRCIAKYAMNYLAHVCGTTFVLQRDFDHIRNFARYGLMPSYLLVRERCTPLLQNDWMQQRQTNGHLLSVNWAAAPNALVGQVSLFNHLVYDVSLAQSYQGLWRPIRSGIHFNLDAKTVEPLRPISRALLP